LVVFNGCASRQLAVNSEPTGADVFSKNNKIGTTPLKIEESDLARLAPNGMIELSLTKDGYSTREFLLKIEGIEGYSLQLEELSVAQRRGIPFNYHTAINEMSRGLLKIQGLIFAKKLDEAYSEADNLQVLYPNVAALHVLKGSISLLKDDLKDSYAHIYRATTLDPMDEQAMKMLIQVSEKMRDGVNAK
jgi:two-component SAPR family response regulator